MYKPKNLLYNNLMHKNSIKSQSTKGARFRPPKTLKMRFVCTLWKRCASGDIRR
ncbi:hypothetical protein Hanom_Chr16g01480351 [Helianthus anomalus]